MWIPVSILQHQLLLAVHHLQGGARGTVQVMAAGLLVVYGLLVC